MRYRKNPVLLYFTDDELAALDEKVKKTGRSRSEYIRTLVSGYVPVEIAPLGYSDLAKELNRVGTNLNQIAAVANTKGFIDSNAYKKNYNDVLKVCNLLIVSLLPKKITDDTEDKEVNGDV